MLGRVNPGLKALKRFPLTALNLLRHDGRAPVHLQADVVNHDTRSAVLQLSILEILVGPADGIRAIILAWIDMLACFCLKTIHGLLTGQRWV